MRHNKTQSIGEVLKLYVKAFKIENKLSEVQIIKYWKEIVVLHINAYTTDIKIYNKVLFVYTKSAVMRNELNFRKEEYKKLLWEKVEKTDITDIAFR